LRSPVYCFVSLDRAIFLLYTDCKLERKEMYDYLLASSCRNEGFRCIKDSRISLLTIYSSGRDPELIPRRPGARAASGDKIEAFPTHSSARIATTTIPASVVVVNLLFARLALSLIRLRVVALFPALACRVLYRAD
jgi:hypothetical protein